MRKSLVLMGLMPIILLACSADELPSQSKMRANNYSQSDPVAGGERWYKPQHVTAGAQVFKANCAVCHGAGGEGAKEWQKPGSDGKYPAPPLNGSGHAWHHPLKMLYRVVKKGSPGGQGSMPPWEEKLSDEEILSAIAWFQSQWSQPIYENWARRDSASRG